MKLKISFNNNTSKEFEIDNVNIIPSHGGDKGPLMLHVNKVRDNKLHINVTSNIIPDVTFLEKIEIVE